MPREDRSDNGIRMRSDLRESNQLEHRLQPLRIPAGWRVGFVNNLYEDRVYQQASREDLKRFLYSEDILQLVHDELNRVLDVGWYPDGDIDNGSFGLFVVELEDGYWGTEHHEFQTRDHAALVVEIERLLAAICNHEVDLRRGGDIADSGSKFAPG